MDIEHIKRKVARNQYTYGIHAAEQCEEEQLTLAQVHRALLQGEILEQYPNTGRGISCLVLGFVGAIPIHIVCGWRGDDIYLITIYIPQPPNFIDPRTRGPRTDG